METMFMQNFGGQTKSIMVFLKVAYGVKCNFTSLTMRSWYSQCLVFCGIVAFSGVALLCWT